MLRIAETVKRIILAATLASAVLGSSVSLASAQTVPAVPPPVIIENDPPRNADAEPVDSELRLVEGILTRPESTPATRQDAAMLLMKRGSDAARDILRSALERTDRPEVQLGVLAALTSQSNPDLALLPEVMKLARSENLQPRVREALPGAIAAYRDAPSVDMVVRAVVKSNLPAEQATLAVALGITGEKMAVEPMIALLASESPAVRAAAADALRSITTVEGLGESAEKWRQ